MNIDKDSVIFSALVIVLILTLAISVFILRDCEHTMIQFLEYLKTNS